LPDARGRRDEQPAHPVELRPFFISKYELTQFQWSRCGGEPIDSRYPAGERVGGRIVTPGNPIESVTWEEARRMLERVKLALPTEAQWEYAARAGTETPWWCGLDSRDAWHAGNVADEYARLQGGDEWSVDRRLDDGHLAHAPVGSFRPNPYGIHDVIGNVAEWCADAFGAYADRKSIGVDGLHEYHDGRARVVRGGSFRDPISDARSSARAFVDDGARSDRVGIRPAMALEERPR
jgi:formylglycine-generating enzyme required for sulfatase activity